MLTLLSMTNSGVRLLQDFLLPWPGTIASYLLKQNTLKYLTPATIIITCLVMAASILLLDVGVTKACSAFMVTMFILVNACYYFKETSAQWYNPPYQSPMYPYIQLFGIASGIALLVSF